MPGFIIYDTPNEPKRVKSYPPQHELQNKPGQVVEFYNQFSEDIQVSFPPDLGATPNPLYVAADDSESVTIKPKKPGHYTCRVDSLLARCPMCGSKPQKKSAKKKAKKAPTNTLVCAPVNEFAYATFDEYDGDPVIIIKPKG